MSDAFRLPRRALLGGAAALPLLGRGASAEETMVIATWGGDYANLLKANVEEPLMKPQQIAVTQDINDEDPRVAKMYASRRLPRGADDVISLQAVRGHEVGAAGLVEAIDVANVPNLAHVLPNLKSPFYAPHIWSPQVIIYNPDKVKEPPKTFTDLLDPKYKGRVGVGDINYFYIMMAAALAATGDVNKVDAPETKALALKLNANGLRLYPSTDSIGAGIKSGEIDVGIMWLARVIMWQNAGIPVKAQFQTEGSVLYISGMVVPKNAPNKPAAWKYLNAMLEPSAQTRFAERMGYLPTVDNCKLTGKVGEQLALPDPAPKLAPPNYDITGTLQGPLSEWWKKNMQA
ncbi:PotD/PotF family extracellular solute-binding protein [Acidisphaera sp. L21]|jgi:putative spermidine/putrescine transport system substrate-binding protein|uniref:ABC transporter substrate-binding protein n=1 Tax=Acidisphaera sp. L21 TaxID=1641851 RepID=UPI00131AB825|nr:extracellular solute-binding protein [Acidisphaera sp. L21]